MKTDDIFKGGVIIRNPEKRTEAMKRYYELMVSLNKKGIKYSKLGGKK
jgi:hypothetical protein